MAAGSGKPATSTDLDNALVLDFLATLTLSVLLVPEYRNTSAVFSSQIQNYIFFPPPAWRLKSR